MQNDQCAPLIRQIYTTTEKRINNSMRAMDLTHAQVCMLFILIEREGGCCSMKELERQLDLSQSTTAGIVKRAEEKGLVECLPDPDDRRSKLVRVTAAGELRHRETSEDIRDTEDWLLHALTPEERPQFISMLQRVYYSISDRQQQPGPACCRKEGL